MSDLQIYVLQLLGSSLLKTQESSLEWLVEHIERTHYFSTTEVYQSYWYNFAERAPVSPVWASRPAA